MRWTLFVTAFLLSLAFASGLERQPLGTDLSQRLKSDNHQVFLPAELAFQASSWLENDRLYIKFYNAGGYYLHRHQFAVTTDASGVVLGALFKPPGTTIVHETLGEMEVFYNSVLLSAPIARRGDDGNALKIIVSYQGCSDAGLCYTPQRTYLEATSQSLLDRLF